MQAPLTAKRSTLSLILFWHKKPELSAQLTAIGHRIVHGGEKYTSSVVIDESVIQGIKDAASFAPLHNPAHLIGIEEALKSFPQLKDKKRCCI